LKNRLPGKVICSGLEIMSRETRTWYVHSVWFHFANAACLCTCASIRAKAAVWKLLFIEHNASYYQYCGYSFLFFDKPYQYTLIGSFAINYMSFGQYLKAKLRITCFWNVVVCSYLPTYPVRPVIISTVVRARNHKLFIHFQMFCNMLKVPVLDLCLKCTQHHFHRSSVLCKDFDWPFRTQTLAHQRTNSFNS
jgi:hypothetical protein